VARLFEPWRLRGLTARNRIVVSPMCQYSARDGLPTPWHLVHLGSRAVGGAGVVCVEATAVTPEGRISPEDLGLWSDAHAEALAPIAAFIKQQGAVPAIQLAHAGRKASTAAPWRGHGLVPPERGGWQPVAPSALPFSPSDPAPRALDEAELPGVIAAFVAAAERAQDAGFELIELHAAHGYLLHQFLSPLSNHRTDAYGGPRENRERLAREVARAVRAVWPEDLPLWARLSVTDWVPGGFTEDDAVHLARGLAQDGVDAIDCSSGGLDPRQQIPLGPGYQAPFAAKLRREAGLATLAVGLITDPAQAEALLADGTCDAVALARELLRDPYWPLHAAHALGHEVAWPDQYLRARP
jgi:2,4-dienoyl-CoA reductase-like NADH-dependent reductase (Old Yellow Enzyme family)